MRNLFVQHLYLWPRNHSNIVSCFKEAGKTPDVIELHINLTRHMSTLQTAILDLINYCLSELKRLNPNILGGGMKDDNGDADQDHVLNTENAMIKSFHKTLQRELDPIWHQLSRKTKSLVADLKTLRNILTYLTQYDCVTFYAYVSALRTTENAMKSNWMVLDAAETMFLTAEARVVGEKNVEGNVAKKPKVESNSIEENPKWTALEAVIKEIKEEISQSDVKVEDNLFRPSEKALIITSDIRTAQQLEDYLSQGAQKVLSRLYNKSVLAEKYGYMGDYKQDVEEPPFKKESKNKGKREKVQKQPNSYSDGHWGSKR